MPAQQRILHRCQTALGRRGSQGRSRACGGRRPALTAPPTERDNRKRNMRRHQPRPAWRRVQLQQLSICRARRTLKSEPKFRAAANPDMVAASSTPAYADGRRDRIAYEQWVASLADGSYRDGVIFWAGNRSVKPTPSCVAGPSFQQGCLDARARLCRWRRPPTPDRGNYRA
jgi:hypothetical protein